MDSNNRTQQQVSVEPKALERACSVSSLNNKAALGASGNLKVFKIKAREDSLLLVAPRTQEASAEHSEVATPKHQAFHKGFKVVGSEQTRFPQVLAAPEELAVFSTNNKTRAPLDCQTRHSKRESARGSAQEASTKLRLCPLSTKPKASLAGSAKQASTNNPCKAVS